MPKIRNRNVNTLHYELSVNKNTLKNVECFGHNVEHIIHSTQNSFSKKTPTSVTSDSEIDSITVDLNKLGGLSSSSSLSWSDEYESGTSKKVHEELQIMDRVLRREEPIPPHYEKDEYEQWMTLFPNISIFDGFKTPVNSIPNIYDKFKEDDELSVESFGGLNFSRKYYNTFISKKNPHNISVIDLTETAFNMWPSRRTTKPNKRQFDKEHKKNRNMFTIDNKPRSLDAGRLLKMSPLKNQINERKLSSKSLFNRQISKEYAESSLEYNSLPFLEIPSTQNLKSHHELSRRKSNRLVLPPLVNDPFRSISAIPRQAYKTFSALPMKSNTSTLNFF